MKNNNLFVTPTKSTLIVDINNYEIEVLDDFDDIEDGVDSEVVAELEEKVKDLESQIDELKYVEENNTKLKAENEELSAENSRVSQENIVVKKQINEVSENNLELAESNTSLENSNTTITKVIENLANDKLDGLVIAPVNVVDNEYNYTYVGNNLMRQVMNEYFKGLYKIDTSNLTDAAYIFGFLNDDSITRLPKADFSKIVATESLFRSSELNNLEEISDYTINVNNGNYFYFFSNNRFPSLKKIVNCKINIFDDNDNGSIYIKYFDNNDNNFPLLEEVEFDFSSDRQPDLMLFNNSYKRTTFYINNLCSSFMPFGYRNDSSLDYIRIVDRPDVRYRSSTWNYQDITVSLNVGFSSIQVIQDMLDNLPDRNKQVKEQHQTFKIMFFADSYFVPDWQEGVLDPTKAVNNGWQINVVI